MDILSGENNQCMGVTSISQPVTCAQNVVAGLGWKLDVFNLQKAVAGCKLEKARVRTLIFQPHSGLKAGCGSPTVARCL